MIRRLHILALSVLACPVQAHASLWSNITTSIGNVVEKAKDTLAAEVHIETPGIEAAGKDLVATSTKISESLENVRSTLVDIRKEGLTVTHVPDDERLTRIICCSALATAGVCVVASGAYTLAQAKLSRARTAQGWAFIAGGFGLIFSSPRITKQIITHA